MKQMKCSFGIQVKLESLLSTTEYEQKQLYVHEFTYFHEF